MSTLLERIATRCKEEGRAEPRIQDGRFCREHTLEVLRETRHVSPYVQRLLERRGYAKVLS